MKHEQLRHLLEAVAAGRSTAAEALARLGDPHETDLGFAVVDQHRSVRMGLPEVIYGEGKEPAHIVAIARALHDRGQSVLATRLSAESRAALAEAFPNAIVNELGRTARIERAPAEILADFRAVVVCAGTTDLPVFEECSETLAAAGLAHDRVSDVGVAGIHRLFSRMAVFEGADAVVVIAGMEGALPSVVGGLVSAPIIAVPTSVGYGAGAHGIAALLGMLTSCASGITVCNIDNGFGAAVAVHRIARTQRKKRS
jgi:NCAIR mutase (PurE)-related protein